MSERLLAPTAGPDLSLAELHGSVPVPAGGGWWRRLFAFAGPGYLIAVGYMDPGNWATDLAGGSGFGYRLLFVVALSSLMAMVLQALAAWLGIATGRDLAQISRASVPRPVAIGLWLVAEGAIIACDLAEVIGAAIALRLLFGLPLVWGAVLTLADTLLILLLMDRGFRWLEAFIVALITLITACFAIEIAMAQPALGPIARGFLPDPAILRDGGMLYIAVGIIGATVMPHNLYLHSSLVQTRAYLRTPGGRAAAMRWAMLDSTLALTLALAVNAAILITAAAVFHAHGRTDVQDIGQATHMLAPILGSALAPVIFAVALLASGLNATVTGTLAGQVVMDGFLRVRLRPWLRRLITRSLAVAPVVAVTAWAGSQGADALLIVSQVVLSLQLPFAMIPLLLFVGNRARVGGLRPPRWLLALGWASAGVIVVLNAVLIADLL